jgi:hypothetical protein
MLVNGVDCVGSLERAGAFVVNAEYMEEEILDNTDEQSHKFKTWKQLIEYLEKECGSGEVYELITIQE